MRAVPQLRVGTRPHSRICIAHEALGPSLSILDGWWIEGCLEGFTGWAFADGPGLGDDDAYEARLLYHKLERVIVPMFYSNPDAYARVMRGAICSQWSLFQYASHGVAVPGQRVVPRRRARVGGTGIRSGPDSLRAEGVRKQAAADSTRPRWRRRETRLHILPIR
jgi:hypothetical protein